MDTIQQYCVAAEIRATKVRKALSQPMTKEEAEEGKLLMLRSSVLKKLYKYFHVAKYPYQPKLKR